MKTLNGIDRAITTVGRSVLTRPRKDGGANRQHEGKDDRHGEEEPEHGLPDERVDLLLNVGALVGDDNDFQRRTGVLRLRRGHR